MNPSKSIALAAAVALACRDAGINLAGQMLVYPVTDIVGSYADAGENARYPSRDENAEGYFLSRAVMEWFAGHYLEDAGHAADWRVSPLRADNLAGVAPAVVCTAWFDPLRDEAEAYALRLAQAGTPVSLARWPGQLHGFASMLGAVDAADRVLTFGADALRRAFDATEAQ